MSIPNPYPNIADKEINDVKTWSSAKIINELQPALDTEITCKETYEDNIVTFNNLNNKEITSLECEIFPIQEGSGTPSPSNPRPISGTSALDIKHSGADTSDYDTTSVALGQTVYGGTADVVGGVGEVTRVVITYDGTENWHAEGTNNFYVDSGRGSGVYYGEDKLLCSHFKSTYSLLGYNNNVYISASGNLNLQCDDITHTVDGIKTWCATQYANGTPLQICYELTTPTDFTFTGQPINSLLGVNNVWTDSGNIKVTTVETGTIGNILKERGILP